VKQEAMAFSDRKLTLLEENDSTEYDQKITIQHLDEPMSSHDAIRALQYAFDRQREMSELFSVLKHHLP